MKQDVFILGKKEYLQFTLLVLLRRFITSQLYYSSLKMLYVISSVEDLQSSPSVISVTTYKLRFINLCCDKKRPIYLVLQSPMIFIL
jgi:hypothetical protein